MIIICFDIDGVICNQVEGAYEDAKPNVKMIALINGLFDRGYRIILSTSRFMGRTRGDVAAAYRLGYDFTKHQLDDWGVKYHELHMGKPRYDIVVDDRAIFYDPDCARIEASLQDLLGSGPLSDISKTSNS
jgi:hypothetical protein